MYVGSRASAGAIEKARGSACQDQGRLDLGVGRRRDEWQGELETNNVTKDPTGEVRLRARNHSRT